MQYIRIKNLEKYHPGYKDRSLIWCKTYFSMLNSDPEFEMLCEIDKWRFIAFTMLELQTKKPTPINEDYLVRKGFNLKDRHISLTIDCLEGFIDFVDSQGDMNELILGGCVYFLVIGNNKSIKIGYTKHLNQRIINLERELNQDVKYLFAHIGTIQKEHEYHNMFSHISMSSEYFKFSEEILDFIEKLKKDIEIVSVTEDFNVRISM